ncbi:hypothetical protein CGZ65_05930 [Neisseria weixii]|nr:hypothetical protein CGZ65_05930 [Neisseria weixii]
MTTKKTSAWHDVSCWAKALLSELKDFFWTFILYGALLAAVVWLVYTLFMWIFFELKQSIGV